ncbi:MAG: hypothetical protein ACFFCQ_16505 [Promethearchaeota archaeon]
MIIEIFDLFDLYQVEEIKTLISSIQDALDSDIFSKKDNKDKEDPYDYVFNTLDFLSYSVGSIQGYNKDLKIFSAIVIAIGDLQLIVASIALYNHINE